MVDYGAGIDPNNNNLQTLKSSLMVNGVTAAGIFMAFSILRTRLDYVYSPRSFLADDKKQFQKPPASGILSSFSWVYPKVIIPMTENGRRTYKILAGRELDREIIKRTSLDAYMFLRMMRMMFTVFALMCVPSVGLLLPLNKRGGNHQAGIDAYSMKNIERGNNALWAHVIYALVFVCVVVYNIINELSVYVQLRRNYLLSPEHASSARSATVMVNSVPRELMDKRKLEKLFSVFPDGVKEVYLSRDVRRITEVVAQRSEYRAKVEKILTKYAIKCDEYYRYRSAAEDAETFELQDRRQRKRGIGTLPMHTNDDALSTPSHARAGDDRRRGPLLLPPFPFNLRALRKDLGPPSQEAIIQEIGPLIRRIEALTGDFKRLKQQLELTKDSEWVEYWSNRKEELSSEIKSIELEIKELEDSRSKLEAQPRPAMSSPRAGQRRKARDRALKLQLEFSNERLKQLHAEASQCRAIFRKSAKLIAPTALGAATKGPDDSDVEEDVTCFQGCMAKLRDVWARVNKCGQKQQQQQQQRSENVFKKKRSAFIQFYSQASAHMAAQLLLHSQPFSMDPKMLEVKYEDIIWANLDIWSWSRNLRFCVSLGITLVLSISWMSMTMTVTSLVSLDSISKVLGGSTGDEFKHQKLVSLVQGVLPSLLTSLLMKVLPEILRALLKFEGRVLQSDIELSLMRRYYYFLIINIFFSAVISSSFLDFIKQWDGNAWKRLLSTLIPSAYVYFITYILIQGWTGSAKEILQIKLLIVRYIKPWLSSDTPRSREEALKTSGFEWSVDIPSHTLIFLIGMTYSVFAPIVNVFAATYYGLFYLVYRYQLLFVYDEEEFSTGGLSFPCAVAQMYFGIYVFEAVFFVQILSLSTPSWGGIFRLLVVAVTIVGTIVGHIVIVKAYFPQTTYLPISAFKLEPPRDDDFLDSQVMRFARSGVRKLHQIQRSASATLLRHSSKLGHDADSGSTADLVASTIATSTVTSNLAKSHSPGNTLSYEYPDDTNSGYYPPELREDVLVKLWVPRDPHNSCKALFDKIPGIQGYNIVLCTDDAYLDYKSRVKLDKEWQVISGRKSNACGGGHSAKYDGDHNDGDDNDGDGNDEGNIDNHIQRDSSSDHKDMFHTIGPSGGARSYSESAISFESHTTCSISN